MEPDATMGSTMNTLNVLALEGLLTIVESIARRVRAPNQPDFGHSFSGSNGSLDGDFLDDDVCVGILLFC